MHKVSKEKIAEMAELDRQLAGKLPVYLPELRVKFICEGHRVKVKVIGAKKVENSYCHRVNFGRP